MKILALVVPLLLLATAPALAADLTCTIPAANVARAIELCDELRQSLRIRSTEWNNDICATQFFRRGLREGERLSTTRSESEAAAAAITAAVDLFESTWSPPSTAICGDGTTDTEAPFEEECDDGNNADGDGCSNACRTE